MASELRHEKLKAQIGFYDSELSMSHFEHQMQDMEPHAGEVFHPPAGIAWKGFLDKSSPSSSKSMAESSADLYRATDFHKPVGFTPGFSNHSESLVIAPVESAWLENRMLMDDSSLRFMDRHSQGLSLSLCPDRPSHIGIQSFELRDQSNHHPQIPSSSFQDGFSGKIWDFRARPELLQEEHHLRNSKYLSPAQQLLTEFCSLGAVQNENGNIHKKQPQKSDQWEEGDSSSRNPNLHSSDLLELQKRKAKLLSMLDEVHRRYRQYCDQMRVVVSSFEAVAGPGSATVYSRLASKAMSKHFRCLKDGIVGQIKTTKKAMGEKDAAVAPGTTKGETPRLKLLDQSLRQQRAFQQMGMESHPWRPQRGLPERSVTFLRAWLFEHFLHPYPSDVDKHILARQTGLSRSQVSNWFINARVRLWKPMVEEMYLEETKERETKDHLCGISSGVHENGRPDSTENPNPSLDSQQHIDDQKPSSAQLLPHSTDSDSLSSIINNSEKRNLIINGKDQQKQHDQEFARQDAFGIVDLDFSSYNHSASVNNSGHHNFGGSNGVSLTLGLQQHGEGGMGGLSFAPSGSQHSLFFSRQHMDDCQPIQYSILEGEPQNLPYRSLMGAQLLHDFAG